MSALRFASLLIAVFMMAAKPALGSEDGVSKAAQNFIFKGSHFVLKDCSGPLPPKACPQGKLVKKSPKQTWKTEDGVQTWQDFIFEGMEFSFRSGEIVAMAVNKATWPAYMGLGVGTSAKKISKALGEPTSSSDSSIGYCYRVDNACASFELNASGIVKSVSWSYYYD